MNIYNMRLLLLGCCALLFALSQTAQAQSCTRGEPLEHNFDSGAKWSLCWSVDEGAGLTVHHVAYQAPNQPLRTVLRSASVAQVLIHYDADTQPSHLLPSPGLGGNNVKAFQASDCGDGELLQNTQGQQICKRQQDLNNLTRVRNTQSIRRNELSLHSWSIINDQSLQQLWRFSEDGEITPTLIIGGIVNRYTRDARYGIKVNENNLYAASASINASWRLAFAIDATSNNDLVSEIEFPAVNTDVVKRPMQKTAITTETHRIHSPENFRGWLISDADVSAGNDNVTKIGYYLDPQSSGFNFNSANRQWPNYTVSFTNEKPCEQFASNNAQAQPECANSLDSFVNNEPLQSPVLWVNSTHRYTPSREDYPAMRTMTASIKIIPFDWSPYTTFSPEPEQ